MPMERRSAQMGKPMPGYASPFRIRKAAAFPHTTRGLTAMARGFRLERLGEFILFTGYFYAMSLTTPYFL